MSEPTEAAESAVKPLLALVITRGLPASGKTSWARRWVAEDNNHRARVNRDDLRRLLHETATYQWPQEKAVTEVSQAGVRALLSARVSVVVDDMNLRQRYVRTWREIATEHGATFQMVEFDVDVDECVRRDRLRWAEPGHVGEPVIRTQAAKFYRTGHLVPIVEAPPAGPPSTYIPDPTNPQVVIVDVDGTLALMAGRGPYDYDRVGTDLPNQPVVDLIRTLRGAHFSFVYVTGRPESCRDETQGWLDRHVCVGGPLFMRADGDERKDAVIKREIFDREIRDRFYVRWVVDDRNQVVRMWRELGLTVLQVAEGAF